MSTIVICKIRTCGWICNGFLHHLTEKGSDFTKDMNRWGRDCFHHNKFHFRKKGSLSMHGYPLFPAIKSIRAYFKKSLISILVLLNTCASFFIWAFYHIQRGETIWLLLVEALKQRLNYVNYGGKRAGVRSCWNRAQNISLLFKHMFLSDSVLKNKDL